MDKGLHIGGRHQDQRHAPCCQSGHMLWKFNVIADQHGGLDPVQVKHGIGVTGGIDRVFARPVQLHLAILRHLGPARVQHHGGVIDHVPRPFGIAQRDAATRRPTQARQPLLPRPAAPLRHGSNAVLIVAGQIGLGADHHGATHSPRRVQRRRDGVKGPRLIAHRRRCLPDRQFHHRPLPLPAASKPPAPGFGKPPAALRHLATLSCLFPVDPPRSCG